MVVVGLIVANVVEMAFGNGLIAKVGVMAAVGRINIASCDDLLLLYVVVLELSCGVLTIGCSGIMMGVGLVGVELTVMVGAGGRGCNSTLLIIVVVAVDGDVMVVAGL